MVKPKRGRKAKDTAKFASIALLSTGVTSLFGIISAFDGDHWNLHPAESELLASQLDAALGTLPGEYYEIFNRVLETYAPWIALSFTAYAIVKPRLDLSAKLRAQSASSSAADGGSDFPTRENAVTDSSQIN